MLSMERETITPKDHAHWLELRRMDLTSTDSSVLIGANKYKSLFELFHEKTGSTQRPFSDNEPMRWGRRFEAPVAQGLAEDFNLGEITLAKDYIRIPDLRVGSSFDYFLGNDGIFEIKTVGQDAARREWILDGAQSEASLYIESQIQWQLGVSGRSYCKIGALIGGNQGIVIHRERDERVIGILFSKAQEFWEKVKEGIPPAPDFTQDCEFIKKLYSFAEPNKVMDAQTNPGLTVLARGYKELGDQVKELESQREEIKARILTEITDNEKILGQGFTISAGMIGEAEISFTRKAYRNLRIHWRK